VALLCLIAALGAGAFRASIATAQTTGALRGHGGPVRTLAISADGQWAVSGSFDQSAIVWTLGEGAATAVLRFHDGAVNAVAMLPNQQFVTAGEDGRIVLWKRGGSDPVRVFTAHAGPIVALAISPDHQSVASASWDGTARITPLDGGEPRLLEGHQGNVNAVAFLADGRLVSAGYDGTLRIWPQPEGSASVLAFPTPLNAVAAARDGEIVTAGADGQVRILRADGSIRALVESQGSPVIGLALSPDEARIGAATIAGAVAIIDRARGAAVFPFVGPGLPVWSLAFHPNGRELLTGGADRIIRRWDTATGEPIGPAAARDPQRAPADLQGSRGAEVFRACAACHTLTPDAANRAGPSLHGVMGRRIATAPGYNFSEALKKLDIVWSPATIAKLFEIGPSRFTPGTKMPEQTIPDPSDREALVRFLERATR
jgi:cytochrome c